MALIQSAILTVRIGTDLKEGFGFAAEGEHCPASNIDEGLIQDDCTHIGVDNPVLAEKILNRHSNKAATR